MKQNYTLKALQQFQCITGDCPSNCCQIYTDIEIDEVTLKSWRSSDATKKLFENIEKIGNGAYVFKRDSTGKCVCLTDSGQCVIHKDFGHKALPDICRVYPRYKKENAWRQLNSLALSCPEVVDLVLFRDKQGAVLEGKLQPVKQNTHISNPFQQISMQLDELTAEVMGLEKFPVNVKLCFLGKVLVDLYHAVDTNQVNPQWLSQLFSQPKKQLYDINVAFKQRKIKPQPVTAGSIWHLVFKFYCDNEISRTNINIEQSKLYSYGTKTLSANEEYEAFYKLVSSYADKSKQEIRKRYAAVFNKYLKVSFLNWGFPWEPMMENHIAGLLCCYIPFAMIQLLLWIKFAESGELDDEYVTEVIYIVERICGHSDKMLSMISESNELLQLSSYVDCFIESF